MITEMFLIIFNMFSADCAVLNSIILPKYICFHIPFPRVFHILKKLVYLYRVIFWFCFSPLMFYFVVYTLAYLLYSIFPFVHIVFKDGFLIYTKARLLNQDILNVIKVKVQTFLEDEIFLSWKSEPSIAWCNLRTEFVTTLYH